MHSYAYCTIATEKKIKCLYMCIYNIQGAETITWVKTDLLHTSAQKAEAKS